ncbi:adhesion G protein-coupled receptor E5 isoform X2 [Alligator mississippiensis]|uniref:adhesion G protein-coupled receptor E5 isoform X2 n=1 Tax=Alligator mississippiensis TaxID=8496 RepID=UPI0028773A6E|nr:adhesion G protein-coupled receptor E5 isoform X2 [Alligator mississippiensis]
MDRGRRLLLGLCLALGLWGVMVHAEGSPENCPEICPENSFCVNATHCTCQSGFKSLKEALYFLGNSEVCDDVNECVAPDPVKCGPDKQCINFPGGFNCTCNPGFTAEPGKENFTNTSGTVCQDIDECVTLGHDACGPNATCINIPGRYNCVCAVGYQADPGKENFMGSNNNTCQDIDECRENVSACAPHGNCINTPGDFMCTCKAGFAKRNKGEAKICIDIDKRKRHPCDPRATCNNTLGNYSSFCPPDSVLISARDPSASHRTVCKNFSCSSLEQILCPKGWDTPCEHKAKVENICGALRSWLDAQKAKEILKDFLLLLEHGLASQAPMEQKYWHVTTLLAVAEDLMRLLGPVLGPSTTLNTSASELSLVLQPGPSSNVKSLHLVHEAVGLELDWAVAADKSKGPALAGLLSVRGLGKVLEGAGIQAKEWTEIEKQVSKWSQEPGQVQYRVVSEVATAIVAHEQPQGLQSPAKLNFTYNTTEKKLFFQLLCAFWEPHRAGGHWSTQGCHLLQPPAPGSPTECICDHLTSFAVLMAFYELKDWRLDVVSRVGLAVSVLCLTLAVLTFLLCRSLRGSRTTIHLHLSLSLLVAHSLFLLGIEHTHSKVGCAVVAGLLHYAFLAAFCWMCLEGAELYVLVVHIFKPSSFKRGYLLLAGYGPPALIVAISAAAFPQGYGTERHCWLSLDHDFLWSFLAPVCLIITVNAGIFVVTVWKLAQKFNEINPDMSRLKKLRVLTVTGLAQLCVLGTGWVLGLFQFGPHTLVLSYAFTIFNALQGFGIFLLHCLLNKQVRDEYCRCFQVCRRDSKYSEFSTTNSTRGLRQESGM